MDEQLIVPTVIQGLAMYRLWVVAGYSVRTDDGAIENSAELLRARDTESPARSSRDSRRLVTRA